MVNSPIAFSSHSACLPSSFSASIFDTRDGLPAIISTNEVLGKGRSQLSAIASAFVVNCLLKETETSPNGSPGPKIRRICSFPSVESLKRFTDPGLSNYRRRDEGCREPALSDAVALSHEKNRYERRFQENLEGIAGPLILIDRDMKRIMINGTAAEYYGITEHQDATGLFCHHAFKGRSVPCEGGEVLPAVLAGESITFERKGIMDPDRLERAAVYPVKDKPSRAGDAVIRVSDITEAKEFERQLIQSKKMASLGVPVSSIAHEINGGRIEVTSEPGVGGTFTVMLPNKERRHQPREKSQANS